MSRLAAVTFSMLSVTAYAQFPVCEELKPKVAFWHQVYTTPETIRLVHSRTTYEVLYSYKAHPKADSIVPVFPDLRVQKGVWEQVVRDGSERARKYLPHVRAELKKRNMPLELAYLPFVESGYNPQATSKVGARGMWQVMPATSRLYGIKNKKLLNDPKISTTVALNILQDNYNKLGSWDFALTAYNHGTAGVKRAVSETLASNVCEVNTRYKGPRYKFASSNFYAQFLAIKQIAEELRL
jgi:Transglycosylase SLT domain